MGLTHLSHTSGKVHCSLGWSLQLQLRIEENGHGHIEDIETRARPLEKAQKKMFFPFINVANINIIIITIAAIIMCVSGHMPDTTQHMLFEDLEHEYFGASKVNLPITSGGNIPSYVKGDFYHNGK
jgi:hypothetical protein